MDMKSICKRKPMFKKATKINFTYINKKVGGGIMTKLLAKLAEKYAKNTNTACFVWFAWHQPKMPASLIKKD